MATLHVTYYAPEQETDKAVKDAVLGWLPKSQITRFEGEGGYTYVAMPFWLKKKEWGRGNYDAQGRCVWRAVDETELQQYKRI